MPTRIRTLQALIPLIFAFIASNAPAQTAYRFSAPKSTLEIEASKAGLFSAFGHDHVVQAKDFSGVVQFDPNKIENASVSLHVVSQSLTVVDPGASPADKQQVQTTMQSDAVLDAARYPYISFDSTRVGKIEHQGDGWRVTIDGTLELHGVEKPVSFPVTVSLHGDDLVAEGDAIILQSDYGIKPFKAAGGAVKVKDRLRIHFDIRAAHTSS